jgi:phytol kinase
MQLCLAVLAVFTLLVVNEIWWRHSRTPNELNRKFVHITVGSFVAFWPFFLSWHEIVGLSVAFLVVVGISKYLHIFNAIHSVTRPSWGEVCFALAVGLVALMTHDKWIYMAALLQMSLADGLAAVIGTTFGRQTRYKLFGHTKSIVGTLTFFVTSLVILAVLSSYGDVSLSLAFIIGLSAGASLIENLGVYGLDNLLVPVVITAFLVNH